jgi:transposase
MEITTVGLDIAKHVFQLHGVDAAGKAVLRRKLQRSEVLAFFKARPACLVGIEACGTAHYWAREIRELGHEVRLMPPSYVVPYVKRGKTDAADAAAICEAVTRPTMRFVPIKTAEPRIVWALLVRGEAYRMPAAILAIPGASIRSGPPTPSPGMMIATGGQLRGPLALCLRRSET